MSRINDPIRTLGIVIYKNLNVKMEIISHQQLIKMLCNWQMVRRDININGGIIICKSNIIVASI